VKGHYVEHDHFLSALTHPSLTSAIQSAVIFLQKLTLDLVKNTKIHCYVLEEGRERKGKRRKREAQIRRFLYSVTIVRSSPQSVYFSRTLTQGKMWWTKDECSALRYMIYKAIIFSELWLFCARSERL